MTTTRKRAGRAGTGSGGVSNRRVGEVDVYCVDLSKYKYSRYDYQSSQSYRSAYPSANRR